MALLSVNHMRFGYPVCSLFKSESHPEVVVFQTVDDPDDADIALGAELLKANPDSFQVFLGVVKVWQKRFDREDDKDALSWESREQKVGELSGVKVCTTHNAPMVTVSQPGKSHCEFKLLVKFSIPDQH